MHRLKPNSLLKSFRFRMIVLVFLIAVSVVFIYLKYYSKKDNGTDKYPILTDNSVLTKPHLRLNPEFLKEKSVVDIDSILSNFGIKKEWITTVQSSEKTQKPKTDKTKKENIAVWYTKYVSIPRDVNTAEINLDLSNYTRLLGLVPEVSEDIRTTDITFDITDPDDTSSVKDQRPLAKIFINHSDKINRDGGTFVILLNNIGDYKKDEADDVLNSTSEFSYIFPRNPDDIDAQNKLIQLKKDVILNVTEGKNDNYDADFRAGMDVKEIKQKVRSLSIDYPAVKTVLLTRTDVPAGQDRTFSDIINELQRYSFRVYTDSAITRLLSKNDEDSKNKIDIIIAQMRSRVSAGKKLITILNLSYDEFRTFYNEVLTLKKLGYKFYTLSRLNELEMEKQKREMQKQEKTEKPKETRKEQPPKVKKNQPKKNAKK